MTNIRLKYLNYYNQIIMELILKKEETYVPPNPLFHHMCNDFTQFYTIENVIVIPDIFDHVFQKKGYCGLMLSGIINLEWITYLLNYYYENEPIFVAWSD